MSSTISSLRSSPIPDLAYDSYRSLSLRDQTLIRRQLANNGGNGGPLVQGPNGHPSEPNFHPNNIPPNQPQDYSESVSGDSPVQHHQIHHQQPILIQRHHQNPHHQLSNSGAKLRSKSHGPNANTISPNAAVVKRRPSSFLVTNGAAYNIEGYAGETFAFWILLGILIILVVGNSILTFVIFGVVRVGAGTESIEFLPRLLKFYGETDLDEIYKRDGVIQGFQGKPVEISGEDGGEVHFWSHEGSQPSFSVEKGAINISQVEEFRVVDKKGREVFSTNTPTLGLPRGVQKLDVRVAKVNRITSAVNASLQLVSTTFSYLKGAEGTHLEGRQVLFKADQDIFLKSVNGNIILLGKDGIHMNVHDLPLVKESGVTRKSYTYTTHGKKEPQYQLCVCMPEGKLFRVEIPVNNLGRPQKQRIGCHFATNPC